jgi:hypothetical protein
MKTEHEVSTREQHGTFVTATLAAWLEHVTGPTTVIPSVQGACTTGCVQVLVGQRTFKVATVDENR